MCSSGCRRAEIIEVQKAEIDTVGSAFRFEDTKEGQSVRPMGLPIVEYFDERDMIQALLDGAELSHTHYALDRRSRKAALARFLASAGEAEDADVPLAA